ncbi:MAG: GAF domain-containing protein [Anaerolineales bacterium]|nr:GAF domain-containing protein [Anaerolineales bacterium]
MEAPGSHSSYQVANHINYPVIDLASNPAVEQMCADQKPIAVEDAQHDPRLAGDHGLFRIQGIASILLVPLIIDGCVAAVLG